MGQTRGAGVQRRAPRGRRAALLLTGVGLAGVSLAWAPTGASAAPSKTTSPNSSRPKGSGGSTGPSFTVSLAHGRSVQVDNWSDYSDSALTSLVQYADRGMATTDPVAVAAAGEMETGDRVVVTDYGIYWLDLMRRGGQLSGIWPISSTSGSTAPNFSYMPIGQEWEPNELLPGSDPGGQSTTNNVYASGQELLVIGYGTSNADGSCNAGYGTFVMSASDVCGVAASGVAVTLSTANLSGGVHAYTVSGTLYQEGTNHDQVMRDTAGHSATISYTLTYDFGDTTDTTPNYGSSGGPANERVRTEITITPSSNIDLGTLVVSDTSDWGASGSVYPYREWDYSNTIRWVWAPQDLPGTTTPYVPCAGGLTGGSTVAAGAAVAVCEGSPYPDNWLSQNNNLSKPLPGGSFVTEMQSSAPGSTTDRELTALVPESTSYLMPENIEHIWNSGLQVSALDMAYFVGESFPVAGDKSVNLGYDLQTVPYTG